MRFAIHGLRWADDGEADVHRLIDNAGAARAAHHRLIVDALGHLCHGGYGGEQQAEGEE